MKKYLILGLISIFWAFFLPQPARADFQFTPDTTSMNADSELNAQIDLNLQGQANKNYYLEGEFKKTDGSNYFGLTAKDDSWVPYSASNFTSLPQVTTDASGHWQGSIKVKLDTGSSLFGGNGDYILKIARFTEGGSKSDSDNQVIMTVQGSSPAQSNGPVATSEPVRGKLVFSFSGLPASLESNQSVAIKVEINNDKPNQDLYLKGAFYQNGSTNYFGQTQVNGTWVKNSASYSAQQKITTDSNGHWSGNLNIMPDGEDSGFPGSGQYRFKVAKYTAAGSGPTWTDSQELSLNLIATPAPVVSAKPSFTPSASAGAVLDAKTDASLVSLASGGASDDNFLMSGWESSESATPEAIVQSGTSTSESNWWLIGLGILAFAASSVPLAKALKFDPSFLQKLRSFI